MEHISRDNAWELLRKYNKDSFHLQHALKVIINRHQPNFTLK